ncbi:ABC transporter substrate-binding protein [Parasphaerochaeta coccoides]|uniref:Uncharacterized protein n=1 Tax=Parasphaerochaeta coccoides (strain ATCC BAA-1237 / DSM 17374 / SPN1) TaxID=760011 RepID=F4GHP3_PARC1|nr:PhnD/SsuA/transferrin family substrate-binding protein [Parasphaerochaeta coccoides]AEC01581.1 hypothetical protein Spico_0351 [Parasphaerochaeta coccoides DSM 17374]
MVRFSSSRILFVAGIILLFMLMIVPGCSRDSGSAVAVTSKDDSHGTTDAPSMPVEVEKTPAIAQSEPELFAAAVYSPSVSKPHLRVAVLNGPTGLGMVKLMQEAKDGVSKNDYDFTLLSSPDEMVAQITSGAADIAALPSNLAAVLVQRTSGAIQLAAVNTLGVLSIVSTDSRITSLEDLRGGSISATGQGAVPEYALDFILASQDWQGADALSVEYKAQHAELATALIAGTVATGMLPEPFVTQVMLKRPDAHVVANLTEEWDKAVQGEGALVMGTIVVTRKAVQDDKQAVDTFLDEYKASTLFAATHVDETARLANGFMGMPVETARVAIPRCNITFAEGGKMKALVAPFYEVLFAANPKSIGGRLPDDSFYYER